MVKRMRQAQEFICRFDCLWHSAIAKEGGHCLPQRNKTDIAWNKKDIERRRERWI
jgi:hypothetical protein